MYYFRWRKLGGKDPPTLELIKKIQTLQKRLTARKEDIVDRETSIREKVRNVPLFCIDKPTNYTFARLII